MGTTYILCERRGTISGGLGGVGRYESPRRGGGGRGPLPGSTPPRLSAPRRGCVPTAHGWPTYPATPQYVPTRWPMGLAHHVEGIEPHVWGLRALVPTSRATAGGARPRDGVIPSPLAVLDPFPRSPKGEALPGPFPGAACDERRSLACNASVATCHPPGASWLIMNPFGPFLPPSATRICSQLRRIDGVEVFGTSAALPSSRATGSSGSSGPRSAARTVPASRGVEPGSKAPNGLLLGSGLR